MLRAKSSQLSFYGSHPSLVKDDRVIPKVHFLKLLNKAVDFSFVNERFTNIFNQIVEIAREKGLVSDRLSIVDSTDVKAKVDTFKIKDKPDASPDKDARHTSWKYKSEKKPFFGYKAHATIDSDSELITKLKTTPGNTHDGKAFPKVVDTQSRMTTADKAYDSNKNHRSKSLRPAQEKGGNLSHHH